jgi:carbon-monoxide dehydrogenase medium subunit
LQAFDYVRAKNIDEVVMLMANHNGRARILSGGTDLLVGLREGRLSAELVIDVKRVPEVSALSYSSKNGLQLGAVVSCQRIYSDAVLCDAYPGLIDAAGLIGGVQIQGRASLGGNLCNASPAADSIPALIALRAVCHIAGPFGRRTLPVEDFCLAPGKNALQNGEFLVYLHIPAPTPGSGAAYLRFIPRNEMDIAVVGCGASVQLDEGRTRFAAAHIALGAVAPTPLYIKEAGEALVGQAVNAESIELAARIAQATARPISDMRGTAEYRRHMCAVMTRRTLEKAIERAKK